ncbi:hypothetical protein [Symbiopectobacterium sp.]
MPNTSPLCGYYSICGTASAMMAAPDSITGPLLKAALERLARD